MSITSALSSAGSGLAAASRVAATISDNVANSMTEGYARRDVTLTPRTVNGVGAGVSAGLATRTTDPRATADRRRAEAADGAVEVVAKARARLAAVAGGPSDEGGLAARAAALENALARLADTPESAALQASAAEAARAQADAIVNLSTETQRLRMEANSTIARDVRAVNESLRRIESINREIKILSIGGGEVAALEDQRQRLVDQVSRLIPVRTVQRDFGQLAIYAENGGVLADSGASELGFEPAGVITADMTLASGALSGLTLNGVPIAIGDGRGILDGGALGARFAVRDTVATEASDQADAVAQDLVARFEDAAADPTLAPGDPGLFTDGGAALDLADIVGLAGRLELNAAIDPARGGAAWRMRDGVGAAAPGVSGDDSIPRAGLALLAERRAPPAGAGVVGARGFPDLALEVAAGLSSAAADAEARSAFERGRHAALRDAEAAVTAVDTDQELARLMLVEQAYAANARVLEAIDGLMRRLMEI